MKGSTKYGSQKPGVGPAHRPAGTRRKKPKIRYPSPDPRFSTPDTITAISTPVGVGAIGIVRLSGSESFNVASKLSGLSPSQTKPYQLKLCWLARADQKIDQALVCYMPAPHSYTGEDMVEFHCHGGPAVLSGVLTELYSLGARAAEAGEFTKRAFVNGKIDLIQAEAIIDLIEANNSSLSNLAADQLAGGVSNNIGEIKEGLLELTSTMAAQLDFSEEDLGDEDSKHFFKRLEEVCRRVEQLACNLDSLDLLRNGFRVALMGLPNAGKSTLLNRLLGFERAIVTEIAGTTRDTISETIQFEGLSIHFTDTAGLNASPDKVESLGIKRSLSEQKQANLTLLLIEPGQEVASFDYLASQKISLKPQNTLVVRTKNDSPAQQKPLPVSGFEELAVSQNDSGSIQKLLVAVHNRAVTDRPIKGLQVLTGRQASAVSQLQKNLRQIKTMMKNGLPHDIVQAELTRAVNIINSLTGEHTTDELIDSIFGRFCIGK